MARPISHDPSRSHYPAIDEPEFNTRNDVPVTPCTVLSALVKIIANYVTALFQYIASFFISSNSNSTPLSATVSPIADSSRDDIEFLHNFFWENGYTATDISSMTISTLRLDLIRDLVHELVINNHPIPFFLRSTTTSTELPENSIEALRHSYNQLNDFDKSYARIKFRDRSDDVLTISSHAGDSFLQRADLVIKRYYGDTDRGSFIIGALSGFRG